MDFLNSLSLYLTNYPIWMKTAVVIWAFLTTGILSSLVLMHKRAPSLVEVEQRITRVYDNGLVSGNYTIDYNNGSHQTLELKGDTVLDVKNWPSEQTALLTLYVRNGPKYSSTWSFVDFFTVDGACVTKTIGTGITQSLWVGEFLRQHGRVYGRFVAAYPESEEEAAMLEEKRTAKIEKYQKQLIYVAKGGSSTNKCASPDCTNLCLQGEALCIDHYFPLKVIESMGKVSEHPIGKKRTCAWGLCGEGDQW